MPDLRPTKSIFKKIRYLSYLFSNACFTGQTSWRNQIELVRNHRAERIDNNQRLETGNWIMRTFFEDTFGLYVFKYPVSKYRR